MSARLQTKALVLACLAAALSSAACNSAPNPCPTGGRPRYDLDRCITPMEAGVEQSSDGAAPVSDATIGPDASSNRGPEEVDAAADAGSSDAIAPEPDASSPVDAGQEVDAGTKEPVTQGICTTADLEAWRSFHVSTGLVETLTGCFAQGCLPEACAAIECTKDAAHVQACDACIDAEAQCLLERCGSACGEPGSDSECRACVCEADCVPAFETCAKTSLAVCTDVFGRDSTLEERVLDAPILIRQKSATGLMQSAVMSAAPSDPKLSWTFTHHQSEGWTKLLSWSQGASDYLLQYKGACAAPPCLARISPVLRDGSLGRPVLETRWPAGIGELELVVLPGRVFVALYEPTRALADGTPGVLRMLEVVEQSGGIALVPRFERQASSTTGPWSILEAFTVGEAVYLAFYDASSGEVAIDTAALDANTLTLREHTRLQWESGLTILETFSHSSATYLMTYRANTGQARIAPLLRNEGKLDTGPATVEGIWAKSLTHIEAFQLAGDMCLLKQSQSTGAVEVLRLASDASAWAASLGTALYVDAWGKKPVWDLVSVAHGKVVNRVD